LPAYSLAYKPLQKLNIFAPKKSAVLKEVLIFIHGGTWNSGRKEMYSFFGSRWARKDVVTVIVDYPKSPKAGYNEMAMDVALASKWVKENIIVYGGDLDKIFISGHSAGGHLAALVGIKKEYFERVGIANPLKGIILIDAAGLDMYGYLKSQNFEPGNTYLSTFSNDPKIWKEASPLYFLHSNMPAMLIYRGSKTYPSIVESNEKFVAAIKAFVPQANYTILNGKKHVPMITQFFNTGNDRYKEMKAFMDKAK
jgi:acetyl esterase/lipase